MRKWNWDSTQISQKGGHILAIKNVPLSYRNLTCQKHQLTIPIVFIGHEKQMFPVETFHDGLDPGNSDSQIFGVRRILCDVKFVHKMHKS